MNAAGATASFFPITIFQDLDWGISARRQSVVLPIPRRIRNYSNFEINSLAVEIASTTTSQIAERLHNSTSRRSFTRSVIADYRFSFSLFVYPPFFIFFIREWFSPSNHVRIVSRRTTTLSEIFRWSDNGTFAISSLAPKRKSGEMTGQSAVSR